MDGQDDTRYHYTVLENLNGAHPDTPLTFSSHNGSEDFFPGERDDIRIYRKALSETELSELYQLETPLSAQPGQLTLDEGTAAPVTLLWKGGGDSEPPLYQIVTTPLHDTPELNGGIATFYPDAHYSGSDQFRFRVTKGTRTAEADIAITVTSVNDTSYAFGQPILSKADGTPGVGSGLNIGKVEFFEGAWKIGGSTATDVASGLYDSEEREIGTNPKSPDTDGD